MAVEVIVYLSVLSLISTYLFLVFKVQGPALSILYLFTDCATDAI